MPNRDKTGQPRMKEIGELFQAIVVLIIGIVLFSILGMAILTNQIGSLGFIIIIVAVVVIIFKIILKIFDKILGKGGGFF